MKNGQCPKCGSAEVYSGANLPLKSGPFAGNAIPVSLISMAALDNYVCTSCGLVESYVADSAKLKEIAKYWDKVSLEESGEER
jgi:predicted nucleic-acid-binding Zn-ribbon protein